MISAKNIVLVGYSGHAYLAADILYSQGLIVDGYTEQEEKNENPYNISYLGNEANSEVLESLKDYDYFVALGDNKLRRKISESLIAILGKPINVIHNLSIVSNKAHLESGILVGPGTILNSKVFIGEGVILNSGSIIEHECTVGNYTHIAPGAVLCGNVCIGENTFIGAGSIILPGITVGNNVIVGAGTVVTRNIGDNLKVVGNPGRAI